MSENNIKQHELNTSNDRSEDNNLDSFGQRLKENNQGEKVIDQLQGNNLHSFDQRPKVIDQSQGPKDIDQLQDNNLDSFDQRPKDIDQLQGPKDIDQSQGPKDIDPIIVYLLTDRPYSKEVKKLSLLFPAPRYKLILADIPPPPHLETSALLTEQDALEIFRFSTVLCDSHQKCPQCYTIVLKDNSVSATDVNILTKVVDEAVSIGEWDLCYLNRWLDRCDLYRDPICIKGTTVKLVKTFSPNGLQSIMFSPKGRNIVIGKCKLPDGGYFTPITISLGTKFNLVIDGGQLSALCAVPNLFEFDVFQATSISDLAKLTDCQRPPTTTKTSDSPGPIPFFWFVLIILIVIIIVWAFYAIGPTSSYNDIPKPVCK